jgi:4-hydroxybenzoate polyprenyltransferase
MLRYRVATMIWLFLLLGAASRQGLEELSWRHLLAALALGASYVAATTQNDVADRDIDLVNHPRDPGRPLVTGQSSPAELRRLHLLASALALVAAAPLGRAALSLVVLSLAVGWAYSLPPLRLSFRTFLAHPALGIAYVTIPYALGLAVVRSAPRSEDALLGGGLYFLFLARIVLKDFRDREGDARFDKPTLLLRFGKEATCLVSLGALAVGIALVMAWLRPPAPAAVLFSVFPAAIVVMLAALRRARTPHEEQVAIGIGARMGNGFLLSLLAWLALEAHDASLAERTAFLATLAAIFGVGFAALVARPEQAVIGYKG